MKLRLSFLSWWLIAAAAVPANFILINGHPLKMNGSVGVGAEAPGPVELPSMAGIHVDGNQLKNEDNVQVQLRGVNFESGEYMCIYAGAGVFRGNANQAGITAMLDWAINAVRIPVNESCWLGINGIAGISGTAYQNSVKAFVDLITANNMVAILDLQWVGPGSTPAGSPPYLFPMPADHSVAFWTSAANKFKDNSSVIFDLYNEPIPDGNQDTTEAWRCLRDGGTCDNVDYPATGMQALVTAVRATGATNPIMVAGIQYANILSRWLEFKPIDPLNQLIASTHNYSVQICNTESCWDEMIGAVAAVVPVVMGEIGQNDCQGYYVNPLMEWADDHNVSYLPWAWTDYGCGYPGLFADAAYTPTGFGIHIQRHFLERVGRVAPPLPPVPFFSETFPIGLAIGRATDFTAGDGTVYKADTGTNQYGLNVDYQYFGNDVGGAYTNVNAIAGTTDDALYQSGRWGNFGRWTFGLPNGDYIVTVGMAQSAAHDVGEYGVDLNIGGGTVAQCQWSLFPLVCPQLANPVPAVNTAYTFSFPISIFGQSLFVQTAASFGGGRYTVLSSIKIEEAP